MTTVSEALRAAAPAAAVVAAPVADPVRAGGVPTGPRARVAVTARDGKIRRLVAGFWFLVRGDADASWWARRSAPTLREVWAVRMPALDRVPGRSRGLWVAWLLFNHAVAIPATVVLNPLMFVLQHPARLLLALVLLSPLAFVIVS